MKHQDELKDEVNTLEKDITILNETETKTMVCIFFLNLDSVHFHKS